MYMFCIICTIRNLWKRDSNYISHLLFDYVLVCNFLNWYTNYPVFFESTHLLSWDFYDEYLVSLHTRGR